MNEDRWHAVVRQWHLLRGPRRIHVTELLIHITTTHLDCFESKDAGQHRRSPTILECCYAPYVHPERPGEQHGGEILRCLIYAKTALGINSEPSAMQLCFPNQKPHQYFRLFST